MADLRRSLLSGALVASLAGTAIAQVSDDNVVVVDQIGADNSADITQSGLGNVAGSDAQMMFQDGFWNSLTITQSGNRNSIGAAAPGLYQLGRFTTDAIFNRIAIEQLSDDNIVESVDQRALGIVPNGANILVIEQSGGDDNRIGRAVQLQQAGQAQQSMTLRQTGADNVIELASQLAYSVDRNEDNVINVTLSGDRNGQDRLGGVAALPLLRDSSVVQEAGSADIRGNGNFVDLLISGDDNAFGIRQGGRENSVGFVTIAGDLNDLGLRQDGDENEISMTAVEGDNNAIGVDQYGTNLAQVNLIGFSNDNAVSLYQQGTNDGYLRIEGDRNALTVTQGYLTGLGGDNLADIGIEGDDNALTASQSGGGNEITVTVTGDDTNTSGSLATEATAAGLVAGVITQEGNDNALTATVTGDRNRVASLQLGDLNAILLTIEGDDNEAALLQSGNRNSATIRQIGVGNRAFVRQ